MVLVLLFSCNGVLNVLSMLLCSCLDALDDRNAAMQLFRCSGWLLLIGTLFFRGFWMIVMLLCSR